MRIMQDYSAHVRMKSIDEGVIDFSDSTLAMQNRDLVDIGWEIKRRLWNEVGCAMNCNVGIATNRFLAKTAASLHKPNGLDVITADNLRKVFGTLELTDLTGIAEQFEKRLNGVGIFTPLQFLDADPVLLQKMVFKSIVGLEWHQRLRGWEVDKRDFPIRTAGRQYVLDGYKMPRAEVLKRLHHLCEETGAKVRSQGLVARGVSVHARSYSDTGRGWRGSYWHARHMAAVPFFSNQAIFEQAKKLFEGAPVFVKEIGVSCYELSEPDESQLHLFGDDLARDKSLTNAVDQINSRYGKRVIHSADTLTTRMVKEKIPFGSTRYL